MWLCVEMYHNCVTSSTDFHMILRHNGYVSVTKCHMLRNWCIEHVKRQATEVGILYT